MTTQYRDTFKQDKIVLLSNKGKELSSLRDNNSFNLAAILRGLDDLKWRFLGDALST